jgi:fatty acid desaturase
VIDATAISRRYSGGVGWPTVLLCLFLTSIYVLVIVGWSVGDVPLWAGFIVNAVLTYAFYTVHHDANHKSISGRNARWRWLDRACGEIAAVPLLLNFAGWSSEHLRHHSHTNDPLHDPDMIVAGPLWGVPLKWLAAMTLTVLGALPFIGDTIFQRALSAVMPDGFPAPTERMQTENRQLRRYMQVAIAVVIASIPLGLFMPVFFLWWLPGRVGILALMVLFQWLPHVPFDSTKRFANTRVNTFRGSTWLLLQQDRHLVHHLYPAVPWYRYRALFREIRPLLEAEACTIEGRDSDPRQPIKLRRPAVGPS